MQPFLEAKERSCSRAVVLLPSVCEWRAGTYPCRLPLPPIPGLKGRPLHGMTWSHSAAADSSSSDNLFYYCSVGTTSHHVGSHVRLAFCFSPSLLLQALVLLPWGQPSLLVAARFQMVSATSGPSGVGVLYYHSMAPPNSGSGIVVPGSPFHTQATNH